MFQHRRDPLNRARHQPKRSYGGHSSAFSAFSAPAIRCRNSPADLPQPLERFGQQRLLLQQFLDVLRGEASSTAAPFAVSETSTLRPSVGEWLRSTRPPATRRSIICTAPWGWSSICSAKSRIMIATGGVGLDDQQSLILLRRHSGGGSRRLAERQETSQRQPEGREAFVNTRIDRRRFMLCRFTFRPARLFARPSAPGKGRAAATRLYRAPPDNPSQSWIVCHDMIYTPAFEP